MVRTVVRYAFRLIHPYYWPKVAGSIVYAVFVSLLLRTVIARVWPRTCHFVTRRLRIRTSCRLTACLATLLGAMVYFWIDLLACLIRSPYRPPPDESRVPSAS